MKREHHEFFFLSLCKYLERMTNKEDGKCFCFYTTKFSQQQGFEEILFSRLLTNEYRNRRVLFNQSLSLLGYLAPVQSGTDE